MKSTSEQGKISLQFPKKFWKVAEWLAFLSLVAALVTIFISLQERQQHLREQEIQQDAQSTLIAASIGQLSCQSTLVALQMDEVNNRRDIERLQTTLASFEIAQLSAEATLQASPIPTNERATMTKLATSSRGELTQPIEQTAVTLEDEIAQFIRDYYTAINERNYDKSWSMLSTKFQREKSRGGFEFYKGYWNTIARVDVQNVTVDLLNIPANNFPSANVTVSIQYTKVDGSVVTSTHDFYIIFDLETESWLFEI